MSGVGLLLLWTTLGNELLMLGYDLLFVPWNKRAKPEEVIIVYMDDESFKEMKQRREETWDRNLHAQILDRLTADRARVVVFDIVFTDDDPALRSATTNFARAIRDNGKVALAADRKESRGAMTPVLPLDELRNAAASWGIAAVYQLDRVRRKYFVGEADQPSLPWAAAQVAGAPITRQLKARQPDTLLNFYGPARWLRHVSYHEVTNQVAGFFRDKCVFIGAQPKTLRALDEADVFPTPHWRWGGELFPGVEVGATAFLNILRGDGLTEMPWAQQSLVVIGAGLLFGASLTLLRPWPATGMALAGVVAVLAFVSIPLKQHVWFGWPILVIVQIPLALAWSLRGVFFRLKFEKEVLKRTLEETTKLVEATKLTAHKAGQLVPDHEMIRLVGKGAYGEVWLARNAVGVYHAVKIVRRAAFPSDVPYEREFKGIQRFMPVSRSHPGLVHVLHVGRNDAERCFYYIMEAADDQASGQKIDPLPYAPKSLASWLAARSKLMPVEILRMGLALSLALEHLHQQRLIHRDIKPGNIIFVNGAPKFADIGLVTDFAEDGKGVSLLGTQGYIPPEGPGSPAADIYALGKVLYEAAVGRDRELFPEVPTAVYEESEESLLRQLLKVIFKACESDPLDRYRTAARMHADLLAIEHRLNQQSTRTG